MQFSIDGKQVEAQASVLTLVLYEQEFGKDLIKDLFGKTSLDDAEQDGSYIDFTLNNWTAIPRVLWAMCKTVDESVPRYREWAKGITGIDMFSLNQEIADAVVDAFFRPAAATEEEA